MQFVWVNHAPCQALVYSQVYRVYSWFQRVYSEVYRVCDKVCRVYSTVYRVYMGFTWGLHGFTGFTRLHAQVYRV